MKLIVYTPEQFDAVGRAIAPRDPGSSLLHRPFVDYYYASGPWCQLYLFCQDDGEVAGTFGLEQLPFACDGREVTLGFGSSLYSLQPGSGAYMFRHWMKSCQVCVSFGGSEDVHQIFRQQKWCYYKGVKTYLLNRSHPTFPHDGRLRAAVKWGLDRTRRRLSTYAKRLPDDARGVEVVEESAYTSDLVPTRSPFGFRFAPTLDHLAWRYATGLPFIRYRLFRVVRGGTVGYVVINDQQERLLVAQCDGEDPVLLSYGILLSVLAASREDRVPREVLLSCAHPAMQQVFTDFGFEEARAERPFVLGPPARRDVFPPADTSGWLINYDIGDNGLRAPFLDQRRLLTVARADH